MEQSIKDKPGSAELLKQALPLMSRHADGFSPASYAVWYEYVQGENPSLKTGVDQIIAASGRLTAEQTTALHTKHLRRDEDATASMLARTGLITLLQSVQTIVTDVGSDSADFGAQLQVFEQSIVSASSIDDLRDHVERMSSRVSGIRNSMASLGEQLAANQAEVSRLTSEMRQLREDATTDPLSGLVNRRAFDQEIQALKAEALRAGTTFSLVMLDIDHFKQINDTYGHPSGDQVIREIAHVLKACVKGADTAARYGGEEFAILLPATALAGALTVGEQVRGTVEKMQTHRANSDEIIANVTLSAGVAQFHATESIEQFIQRADEALYRAKLGGRNRVCKAG